MNRECDPIRNLIADSVTEPLPPEQASRLDEHLEHCEDCRRYGEALRREDRLLDRLVAGLGSDMPVRKEQLLQDLSHRQSQRINYPTGWRKIMRSRATRLTAAGLILAAAIIGVCQFGTVVQAVEFSEITKAMEQVPWMRVTTSGFQDDKTQPAEQWVGFASKIHAIREASGYVRFENIREQEVLEYVVGSNSIEIRHMEDKEVSLDLTSPALWFESLHRMYEERGARITARRGDYQGHRVQIQEISLSLGSEQWNVILYIDPETKRLHGGKAVCTNATGKVTADMTLHFDYPMIGPQNIYDLGVPRDAKVVSNMPGWNVHRARERYRQAWGETSKECGVMERYWQARDEATREYLAVIAHNTAVNLTDAMNMVDVDYKSGTRHRQERHSVFETGRTLSDEVWAQSRQELGDTYESSLAWTRDHYAGRGRIDIYLYDGQYDCSMTREHDNWGQPSKHYHPEGSIAPEIALSDLAWPEVFPPARIIEDDYAAEHGLICFERLQQGSVRNGTVSLPGRFLWYLDPAQDYLCRRKVTQWQRDADWQEDKEWLEGADRSKVPESSGRIEDITETFQASNGHWYPIAIAVRSGSRDPNQAPPKAHHIKRIYLDLSPEFPEGIFDIDRLPGQ